MDNISQLLQEAKPLYIARKKMRNRIKKGLCSFTCVAVLAVFMPQNQTLVDNGEWVDYEQYVSQVSPLEELGLPVDEYGFLKVG